MYVCVSVLIKNIYDNSLCCTPETQHCKSAVLQFKKTLYADFKAQEICIGHFFFFFSAVTWGKLFEFL